MPTRRVRSTTYKFSVASSAFVFTPGGAVILTPANVYMRGAGGTIAVDLDWSAEGINLASLNALDCIDPDTYLFSVGAAQVVIDGAGTLRVLYPSRVYRFVRTTGAIDEVLDAAPLGMANVNGIDLLPDGRLALTSAAQGIAQLPGGPVLVHPARIYITDPAAGSEPDPELGRSCRRHSAYRRVHEDRSGGAVGSVTLPRRRGVRGRRRRVADPRARRDGWSSPGSRPRRSCGRRP
ncbi:MAG: hypothetical protein GY716_01385 [bacterium]|nr:hypothetical protein [bacterium]